MSFSLWLYRLSRLRANAHSQMDEFKLFFLSFLHKYAVHLIKNSFVFFLFNVRGRSMYKMSALKVQLVLFLCLIYLFYVFSLSVNVITSNSTYYYCVNSCRWSVFIYRLLNIHFQSMFEQLRYDYKHRDRENNNNESVN